MCIVYILLYFFTIQVASGLAYLHEHKIVYYDLKSPNILVFKFPLAQESLQATQTNLSLTSQVDDQPSPQHCSGNLIFVHYYSWQSSVNIIIYTHVWCVLLGAINMYMYTNSAFVS